MAQTAIQYPTAYSQFFNNYSLFNPAATGMEGRLLLRAGEQFHAGQFSSIRSFFAQAETILNPENKEKSNSVGISFVNNRQGNLLALNRAYFQFSHHVSITSKWKFAGGISIGFLNFTSEQTSTSGKVSSFAPDGSFGLMLISDKVKTGLSSSQIFDRYLTIINEQVPVNRFYTFLYSRSFDLHPEVMFIPSVYLTANHQLFFPEVNTSFLLKKVLYCGISYRHKKGSAYFTGIKDLLFMGGLTDVIISYNAPWPSARLGNIQTFEVILNYKRK